jgi:hypothetical protein
VYERVENFWLALLWVYWWTFIIWVKTVRAAKSRHFSSTWATKRFSETKIIKKLVEMWKEAVVAYFIVVFRNLLYVTVEIPEISKYPLLCICVCVRACVHARARVLACACAGVHVALLIQHATRMRHIVTSYVAPQAPLYFSTLSHKRHDFLKKSYWT